MNSQIIMPSRNNILKAAMLLNSGQLVAIPTETVYGLAANALDDRAVARIYELKNRPQFNPLIIHVADIEHMSQHVVLNDKALRLAKAFWPGPMTLVLPRKETSPISLLASAGLDTLAVRIPNHSLCLEILKHIQVPLAAPSANPSQSLSPTLAEHVDAAFNDHPNKPMIIDGGRCAIGLESTIIDLSEEKAIILRPGAITPDRISAVLGESIALVSDRALRPKAPGMLHRHYAPNLPLRLNASSVNADEGLLAFAEPVSGNHRLVLNLSESGDLTEAAANLFKMLRILDESNCKGIAVMPIPNSGIGLAINDRLWRAAVS
jgi:L-threonylcarbamoyladenylate synthase